LCGWITPTSSFLHPPKAVIVKGVCSNIKNIIILSRLSTSVLWASHCSKIWSSSRGINDVILPRLPTCILFASHCGEERFPSGEIYFLACPACSSLSTISCCVARCNGPRGVPKMPKGDSSTRSSDSARPGAQSRFHGGISPGMQMRTGSTWSLRLPS
jgi:hypothetical protein